MTKLHLLTSTLLFSIITSSTLFAQEYDLVINDGSVMYPETKYDAVSNVWIKEGKIALITQEKIKCKQSINAKGVVVEQGFIDGQQQCIEH